MIRDFHDAIMAGGGYGNWLRDGLIGLAGIAVFTVAPVLIAVACGAG